MIGDNDPSGAEHAGLQSSTGVQPYHAELHVTSIVTQPATKTEPDEGTGEDIPRKISACETEHRAPLQRIR